MLHSTLCCHVNVYEHFFCSTYLKTFLKPPYTSKYQSQKPMTYLRQTGTVVFANPARHILRDGEQDTATATHTILSQLLSDHILSIGGLILRELRQLFEKSRSRAASLSTHLTVPARAAWLSRGQSLDYRKWTPTEHRFCTPPPTFHLSRFGSAIIPESYSMKSWSLAKKLNHRAS